ncbi:MAG: hypothetical protein ABIX46_02000, partial [Burkholderiaceae bacterium]
MPLFPLPTVRLKPPVAAPHPKRLAAALLAGFAAAASAPAQVAPAGDAAGGPALRTAPALAAPPRGEAAAGLPIFLEAQTLRGNAETDTVAEGEV